MIEIERLHLRLPHLPEETGRDIARRVGRYLADYTPPTGSRRLDRLDLRLTLTGEETPRQIADRIARAIGEQIDRTAAPDTVRPTPLFTNPKTND